MMKKLVVNDKSKVSEVWIAKDKQKMD